MFGRIDLWKHLFLDFACWEFIANSISLLVICLFIFSIPSWFNFGRFEFVGIFPFLLGYPFCQHIIICSALGMFCISQLKFLLFHFWFYWFEPSHSFLMRLAKGLSTYLNLFKDLSFIDLFYCFSSFSFISAMTLIIYFLLLKLFLVLLSVKARLFYLVFFMLPKVGLYCYKLLWTFLLCSIDFGSLYFICFQIFL